MKRRFGTGSALLTLLGVLILAAVFHMAVAAAQGSPTAVQGPTAASPEAALRKYFEALSTASNLTDEQLAAAGGSVGSVSSYRAAYGCWSAGWQARHPYEQFLASWAGTVHVDLLRLLPAKKNGNRSRFYVEVKSIEAVGPRTRLGIFYYRGFFDVERTATGWAISGGSLEPESLAFRIGGHQPWQGDPLMVARVAYAGNAVNPTGNSTVRKNADGTVTVEFAHPNRENVRKINLVQRQDGIWEVLQKL